MPLFLSEDHVRSVLTMPDLIAAMRPALIEFSTGRAQQPLRTVLELGESRAFFGVMPAALAEPAAVGTKLVTVFAANRALGLPSHLATILLLDPGTGALLAVMDGRYITEARTAAKATRPCSSMTTSMMPRSFACAFIVGARCGSF